MIEVTGLDAMRKKLEMLDQQVRTEFVLKAVKAGATVIGDAMKENAPVLDAKTAGSDALEPGALQADIKVRERLDKDGFAVAKIGPGKKTAHVAPWVEYGHRMVKGGRRANGHLVGQVPAYPFLRPAYERSETEAIEKFKATMQEELKGALR